MVNHSHHSGAPLERSPEEIRTQICATRCALAEKLETAEERAKELLTAVQQTVEDSTAAAKETVRETVDTAKQALDIRRHVQRRPWTALGVSAAAGFLLGRSHPNRCGPANSATNGQENGVLLEKETPDPRQGLKTKLWRQFEDEILRLEHVAMSGLCDVVHEWIRQAIPANESQRPQTANDPMSKVRYRATHRSL